MRIRLGYDLQFDLPVSVPVVAMLNVHPSRAGDLLAPDCLRIEPNLRHQQYIDNFGNLCTRFNAAFCSKLRQRHSGNIKNPIEFASSDGRPLADC